MAKYRIIKKQIKVPSPVLRRTEAYVLQVRRFFFWWFVKLSYDKCDLDDYLNELIRLNTPPTVERVVETRDSILPQDTYETINKK